jgi:exopolysaccharide production protein ExoQ
MMKIQSRQGFHFHNLYYEILMQLGYAGIVAGSAFIAYAVIQIFSWLRRNPGVVSAYCAALAVMILSSQGQEIGLFSQFELYSYAFIVAVAYAASWSRQAADLQRGRVWRIRTPTLGRPARAA